MPDMNPSTRRDVSWEKYATWPAGTRIVIVINPTSNPSGSVLFDQTVPALKKAQARISIDAEILDA